MVSKYNKINAKKWRQGKSQGLAGFVAVLCLSHIGRLSKVADDPVNLVNPSSGATGTSATLLSLSARPEFKDFVEKSVTQCVGGTTLPQILQDLDSFLVSIS